MQGSADTFFPDINADRLLSRLDRLAAFGAKPSPGITRPGFSAAANAAAAFVAAEAREAGLNSRIDTAGNLLLGRGELRPDPSRPVLLAGSHLDTVINGGRLDGAYGVIAALEALNVLTEQNVQLHTEVAAVAFANEEGALFPQAFWGSLAFTGNLGDLARSPADYEGNSLSEALTAAGGDLSAIPDAAWPTTTVAGYLELHIEQGVVLESAGLSVGVVDVIVGRTVLKVDLWGTAAHAGTTAMKSRRDPLVAAADLVTYVRNLSAALGKCSVATVGRLVVDPNTANTVAGHVALTIDLRDPDPRRLSAAESEVRNEIVRTARRHRVSSDCVKVVGARPAAMDTGMRKVISAAADELGLEYRVLNSGAGHDAQIMAPHTPTAMIFVPSISGISHAPPENTAPDDLIAGARLLLRAICHLGTQ